MEIPRRRKLIDRRDIQQFDVLVVTSLFFFGHPVDIKGFIITERKKTTDS